MLKHVIRLVTALGLVVAMCSTANAQRIGWRVIEVYSNADTSSQFVQFCGGFGSGGGDQQLAGQMLTSSNGSTTHSFVFPINLPGDSACFLVGTQGFADLNFVKPDYVVPNGFLFVPDGSVSLATFDSIKYAGLPTDGFHAIATDTDERPINGDPSTPSGELATATNFAGASYTFGPAPRGTNFGGLWWNSPAGSEPGWGIAVEHQGDIVFATWATYDVDGSPVWFVIPRADLLVIPSTPPPTVYSGAIYRPTGPAFSAVPFDPTAVTLTKVGNGGFAFHDDRIASDFFIDSSASDRTIYSLPGASRGITRQVFSGPVPVCVEGGTPGPTPNFQGLWWNVSEAGWGLHLTHQGDIIFAVWLTYDAAGKATWLTATMNKTAPNTYAGAMYRTTNSAAGAPVFDASAVTATQVGTATLTFSDRSNGAFSYVVNGVAQTKNITRQIFADPPTVCN